jgi:hypothetical protein
MRARSLFEWVYPPLAFLWARREISKTGAEPVLERGSSKIADALLDAIYDSETERRHRIEDKLGGLLGYLTFLIPLALAFLGVGLRHHQVVAPAIAILALTYLVPTVFLVMEGSRARPVYVVGIDAISEVAALAENDQMNHIRELKLQAIRGNMPLSWDLNNALSTARSSLVWGLVLASLSVGLTLARVQP